MSYKNKREYGKMPIRKYLVSGHHHIIVTDYDEKQYVSVGLTSDDPKNKRNQ